MIRAFWSDGRWYCDQIDCKNESSLTRDGDKPGTVAIGNRWVQEEGSDPPLFTHVKPGRHGTFTLPPDPRVSRDALRAMRRVLWKGRAAREIALPVKFVCEVCGTPNLVDEP